MALPTTGLLVNLDAKTLSSSLINNGVAVWSDQSGNGNDCAYDYAGGSTPAYLRPNMTPNGSVAMQFSNGEMTFGSTLFDGAASAEVFIYVRIDSLTADNSGLYQFGGNDNTYYTYSDGYVYDGSFTNSRYSFAAAPTITAADWHIYNVSHDGTTRTTRVDGTAVHTVNAGFVVPSLAVKNSIRLGRSQGTPWQGYIAGVIVYKRALSSSERTDVVNYLNGLYAAVNSPQVAQIPAASLKLDLPVTYNDPTLVVPAAGLTLGIGLDPDDSRIIVPAAGLTVDLSAAVSAARLVLAAPIDGAVLPSATVPFTVAVTSTDLSAAYTIDIQYADNAAMTNATTLTGTTDAVTGGLTLTATTPATTYWRARMADVTGALTDWSPIRAFTVAASSNVTVTLPVTWTVDAAANRPIHLWHVDPAGPDDGDTVTVYGQGFPASGTLTFGDITLATTGWQRVAASAADADDSTRTIDGQLVTPEHYEVTFVAPVYNGPGAALVLES